jgi:hypothetical protein
MPKALPPNPHIDWLRKTAKERLAALRARSPAAKLHEAQHEVANEYGFASWRALKARVDAQSLDGQVLAATIKGRARELDALLAAHPRKIAVTGGTWKLPLLHHAAENGHLDCVEMLLRRGFDPHTRDQFDNASALHWAAQGGHLAIVKRLLAAGVDIDGEGDLHELGAIGWATCFKQVHADVADYLLAQGAKPTIFSAIALDRADLVRELIAGDRSLLMRQMSKFENHRTTLHFAVLQNRPAMVALLIELGADVNAKDDRGNTPLALATAETDKAIVESLLKAGAAPKDATFNHFAAVIPVLNVKNVPASIDYYVNKLAFELEWQYGDPPGFACVVRDKVRIFLCEGAQGAPGMWMVIDVQDVDALYDDYKRRGAIIRQPPTNFPWGMREMNVQDLDGHRLRIGGPATGPADNVDLNEEP